MDTVAEAGEAVFRAGKQVVGMTRAMSGRGRGRKSR